MNVIDHEGFLLLY